MMVKIKYKIISLTYCLDPSNFQHLSMSMVAAVKTETPRAPFTALLGRVPEPETGFPQMDMKQCANAEPPPFGCGGVAGVL